ncbi:MAG: hypothetical protein K8U03_10435 [Planctomycetia bacterium]|nr:hypothetical protein [Planctomycetia bacterium]
MSTVIKRSAIATTQALTASLMLMATALLAAEPSGSPTFDETVQSKFAHWDRNRNDKLEADEINPALIDLTTRGADAAALAAIHLYQRRVKNAAGTPTWPPLTLDFLLRKTAEHAEGRRDKETAVPNFRIWYAGFIEHVRERPTTAFSSGAPSLEGFKQGRLGDCFFLATIGSAVHRRPDHIRSIVSLSADGSYRVEFGDGETVEARHLTDAQVLLGSTAGDQGLWLNILEQAFSRRWAASHKRSRPDELSLDVLSRGGHSRDVIPILTGHRAKLTLFRKNPEEPPTKSEVAHLMKEVAEILTTAQRAKHITTTGTLSPKHLPAGIPSDHVLAVLDYDHASQTVEVWNPWCNHFEPQGTPGLENGYPTKGGRFTMPLADFIKTFNGLTSETAERATEHSSEKKGK